MINEIDVTAENNANKNIVSSQLIEDVFQSNTQNTDTIFGIVAWDLNTNNKYSLNEDKQFESASLYKLAVMYTLFYLDSKGKLDTGKPDIKDNLNPMITISSNEAALYLVENYTSWQEITELMAAKGLKQTNFTQDELLTTPSDIAKLLAIINDPSDISKEASKKMMELLENQTINDRIPKLLPKEATVFHKTGDWADVTHDAGIVIGPNNTKYILVIMTKNSKRLGDIQPIMAEISLEIYNLFTKN